MTQTHTKPRSLCGPLALLSFHTKMKAKWIQNKTQPVRIPVAHASRQGERQVHIRVDDDGMYSDMTELFYSSRSYKRHGQNSKAGIGYA